MSKKVSRKQKSLPGEGFAAPEDEEIVEACDRLSEARSAKKSGVKKLNDMEKQREIELITLMRSKNILAMKFLDDEKEEVEVKAEQTWKVYMRKTGEHESEVGEGVESGDEGGSATPPPAGLLRQVERDMDGANVAENADGDVTVPEKSAAKSKKKSSGKGGAKKPAKGRKR